MRATTNLRRATPIAWALSAFLALASFGEVSRAGDAPDDPLENAERLERQGKELFEQGHKAEAAKLIAKAWAIRAEVFGREERAAAGEKPAPAPEGDGERLKVRIAELEARSNELEKAGHKAKEAGREEDAKEYMEASGREWREAKALREKLARLGAAPAGPSGEKAAATAELQRKIDDLVAEAAAQEHRAKERTEQGREAEAAEALAKSRDYAAKAEALRAQLGKPLPDAGTGRAERGELRTQFDRLRTELGELRRIVEDLRKVVEGLRK